MTLNHSACALWQKNSYYKNVFRFLIRQKPDMKSFLSKDSCVNEMATPLTQIGRHNHPKHCWFVYSPGDGYVPRNHNSVEDQRRRWRRFSPLIAMQWQPARGRLTRGIHLSRSVSHSRKQEHNCSSQTPLQPAGAALFLFCHITTGCTLDVTYTEPDHMNYHASPLLLRSKHSEAWFHHLMNSS